MKKELQMNSLFVEAQMMSFFRRLSHGWAFRESKFNELGVSQAKVNRVKRWAEDYFGFKFSDEDMRKPVASIGDLINLTVKYCHCMRTI